MSLHWWVDPWFVLYLMVNLDEGDRTKFLSLFFYINHKSAYKYRDIHFLISMFNCCSLVIRSILRFLERYQILNKCTINNSNSYTFSWRLVRYVALVSQRLFFFLYKHLWRVHQQLNFGGCLECWQSIAGIYCYICHEKKQSINHRRQSLQTLHCAPMIPFHFWKRLLLLPLIIYLLIFS